jgi:hypothetical protein
MRLLTKKVQATIPPLQATHAEEDPMVWVKFFAPWCEWEWYVLEGEPDEEGDDYTFNGWVIGWADDETAGISAEELDVLLRESGDISTEAELEEFVRSEALKMFMLSELEEIRGPEGARVERDLKFRPCRLSEVKKQHGDATAPPDDASQQRS